MAYINNEHLANLAKGMNYYDQNTHKDYYQGNNLGHYQFTPLEDIITQFQIAYIGENKIISKAKRADVAFHAQRALQELSFDTFKSCKSQQITVPSTLKMKLPHDYINYTKITSVDNAGIEHILYPTDKTSNPFQISQENEEYAFLDGSQLVINNDFSLAFGSPWINNETTTFEVSIVNEELTFNHNTHHGNGENNWGYAHAVYQEIDVSNLQFVNLSATGTSGDNGVEPSGVIRIGLSLNPGSTNIKNFFHPTGNPNNSPNDQTSVFNVNNPNVSYLEWTSGTSNSQELLNIPVSSLSTIYVLITSYVPYVVGGTAVVASGDTTNKIDTISIKNSQASNYLTSPDGNIENSSTWNSYKSTTPSENNNDDYEDDTYWPANGERYGLDPQHAQINGSFYIDCRLGQIHFSSNINGKNVILHYISDSRGTEGEMQVHKFAEEAIYKWIIYGILSTQLNIPENTIRRFKKEKFAETRKAKLRLSNIKLEEITQVLRGKSKQIKH